MHSNLAIDTQVFTSDGQELGKVKEIRGNYFKVNAPMAKDYWLSCDCVTAAGTAGGVTTADSMAGNRVQLSFPKDSLDHNKVDEPVARV